MTVLTKEKGSPPFLAVPPNPRPRVTNPKNILNKNKSRLKLANNAQKIYNHHTAREKKWNLFISFERFLYEN